MEPVLQVEGLTKHYGATRAVEGLNLQVHPGEMVGLLGPNGAGKTTTIECVLGLRRPDSGRVLVAGADALTHPRRARARFGAQLQVSALPDKMTPLQALKLFGAFRPSGKRPEDSLRAFGLLEKADVPFQRLSGGQQQRLTLALAFLGHPPLLVLDEPTAGLDPAVRGELLERIKAARGKGSGILMSTHALEEAERHCDRLAVVDRGRLVAAGTPSELVARASAAVQIRLRTLRPLKRDELERLPQLDRVTAEGDGWSLHSRAPNESILALSAYLLARENVLEHLEILRPSLADVFLELTGRSWPGAEAVA